MRPAVRTGTEVGARRVQYRLSALALGAVVATFAQSPALAHDIPLDVVVRAFAKPEHVSGTDVLHLVLRVPLKSIQDVEYPRRERDYVDLTRVEPALRDAATLYLTKQIDLYQRGALLPEGRVAAVRLSLESDRSFTSYGTAVAHVTGPPLPLDETLFWEQGLLDVLLEYPIESSLSDFAIDADFGRLGQRVIVALQFLTPSGTVRGYQLEGETGPVPLDPRWHQVAQHFVHLGIEHILTGADHLLFLVCLVLPFRRVRPLVPIVTAFTAAHSITLIAAAFSYGPEAQWFPPLVETLIAASIVYMAFENIVVANAARHDRRWMVAFGFGLVHGFGFSFGLQHTLQFAGSHLLTALLSFNLGVEIGQFVVLTAVVPALVLFFRLAVAERVGTIVLSALVAHTSWHWMADRYDVLRQYPWPSVTAAGLANGLRWAMAGVLLLLLYCATHAVRARIQSRWSSTLPERNDVGWGGGSDV